MTRIKNLTQERIEEIKKRREEHGKQYMLEKSLKNKTSEDNIRELQKILVQTAIDYINEHNLGDIERIDFMVDNLQCSASYGEWTPSTDSSISCYETNILEENKYIPKHELIGSWC